MDRKISRLAEQHALNRPGKYVTCEKNSIFVSELIANKEAAWKHFIDESSKIIAMHRKHLKDMRVEIDDLVSEIYLYLTENECKRLRKFQENGKSFIGFVYYAVKAAKSRLLYRSNKNRLREMSDIDVGFPHMDSRADEFGEKLRQRQQREILNNAFLLLWQNNSSRASVYMLRRKLELSSKEVATILGIKVNNVDVTLSRAEHEMKNILEEMGATNDILFDY